MCDFRFTEIPLELFTTPELNEMQERLRTASFRMPTFDVEGPREEPTSFDVKHKPRRRNATRRSVARDG
jgi:hypothetical protein